MEAVRITSWFPKYNGPHFGLLPSSIHTLTRLGGKGVWNSTYELRPHIASPMFHDNTHLCTSQRGRDTSAWFLLWTLTPISLSRMFSVLFPFVSDLSKSRVWWRWTCHTAPFPIFDTLFPDLDILYNVGAHEGTNDAHGTLAEVSHFLFLLHICCFALPSEFIDRQLVVDITSLWVPSVYWAGKFSGRRGCVLNLKVFLPLIMAFFSPLRGARF